MITCGEEFGGEAFNLVFCINQYESLETLNKIIVDQYILPKPPHDIKTWSPK